MIVFTALVLFEKVEQDAQCFAAWRLQIGVAGEDEFGVVAGGGDEVAVHLQIRDAEAGEAGLALAQEFAGATQAQVFLGYQESVVRVAQAVETGTRRFAKW